MTNKEWLLIACVLIISLYFFAPIITGYFSLRNNSDGESKTKSENGQIRKRSFMILFILLCLCFPLFLFVMLVGDGRYGLNFDLSEFAHYEDLFGGFTAITLFIGIPLTVYFLARNEKKLEGREESHHDIVDGINSVADKNTDAIE